MNFGLSDEQAQLDDAERTWLHRHDPIARLRTMLDSAPVTVDPAGLEHLTESGLSALLTEDMGGSHVDLAVISEALGWAASSLPVADIAVAAWLLEHIGSPQAGAAAEAESFYGVARLVGATPHLTTPVPMAADLNGVVVVGGSTDGEFCVVLESPQLVPMETLDLSRTWARVHFDPASEPRTPLPTGTVDRVSDALAVHRALDALGAAARLLEMTVTYAGQREQFGVPIGSFQAVKHHCANMTVGLEAGRAALWAACVALDDQEPQARSRAAAAGAAFAKSAAAEAAGAALQVHGGIGFTWEHDLHLLLRRIKVDQAMDGTVAEHRAALVTA